MEPKYSKGDKVRVKTLAQFLSSGWKPYGRVILEATNLIGDKSLTHSNATQDFMICRQSHSFGKVYTIHEVNITYDEDTDEPIEYYYTLKEDIEGDGWCDEMFVGEVKGRNLPSWF